MDKRLKKVSNADNDIDIINCNSNPLYSDHSMTNSTLSLFCFRLYYVFYTLCSSAGATTYTTMELHTI